MKEIWLQASGLEHMLTEEERQRFDAALEVLQALHESGAIILRYRVEEFKEPEREERPVQDKTTTGQSPRGRYALPPASLGEGEPVPGDPDSFFHDQARKVEKALRWSGSDPMTLDALRTVTGLAITDIDACIPIVAAHAPPFDDGACLDLDGDGNLATPTRS